MRTFVLFLLLIQPILAQNLHDWQVITNMNDVTDIEFLNNEILVGTSGGIYRFNPNDSSHIKYTNVEGLASLDITTITSDNHGNILAGSKDGIICFYDNNSDSWDAFYEIRGREITDLTLNDDTLWVATDQGVGVYINQHDRLEFRDFYDNLPVTPQIGHRVIAFDSYIFYATENGLLFAPSNFINNNLKIENVWHVFTSDDGLPSNEVLDLALFEEELIIATSKGAVRLGQSLILQPVEGWTRGQVKRIVHSNQKLYFMNAKDYFLKEDGTWIYINSTDKIISCGLIDNDNVLWLGLERGGLKKDGWTQPYLVDGPYSNHIGGVGKDINGVLWMTSGKFKAYNFEGYYQYDFKRWLNYKFYGIDWNRKNATIYVYGDSKGNVLIGAWGGGVTIISDTGTTFIHGWSTSGSMDILSTNEVKEHIYPAESGKFPDCLVGAPVDIDYYTVSTFFIEDLNGNIWTSNFGAGDANYIAVIPKREDGTLNLNCDDWIYFGANIGMGTEEGEISCLEFDDLDRLWIGTFRRGILVLDYNRTIENKGDDVLYKINMTTDNLYSNTILSIKKDQDGVIWIGTDGGLNSYQVDPSGLTQIFYKHGGDVGPVNSKINQIYIDGYNNKWFATDGGLSLLKADRSAWDQSAWVHYTTENSGLPHPVVNSVFVDSDIGETYLGTEKGLAIFSGPYSEYKSDFSKIVGGPNPYILNDGSCFILKNLVPNATVKIVNINGRLTKILTQENGMVQGSRASWDGRDSNNELVPSGIYLYLVYNEEGLTGKGKIAVLKP